MSYYYIKSHAVAGGGYNTTQIKGSLHQSPAWRCPLAMVGSQHGTHTNVSIIVVVVWPEHHMKLPCLISNLSLPSCCSVAMGMLLFDRWWIIGSGH